MSGMMIKLLIAASSISLFLSSVGQAQVSPLPLPTGPQAADSRNKGEEAAPLPPLPGHNAPIAVPISSAPIAQKPPTIQVLPQVAAPTTQAPSSSELSEFYMPGVVSAILEKKIDDLPDTKDMRRYLFSIHRGLTGVCGARGSMAEIDGMGYVIPGIGPGRDIAEFGGKQVMGLVLSMAQMMKTGDINPYLRKSVEEAPQISEGLTDGATIASKFGCNSNAFNAVVTQIESTMRSKAGKDHSSNDALAFNALMSPNYRNQLGIEDPTVTIRKRKIKMAADRAHTTCKQKYDSPSFCKCLFSKIHPDSVEENDWTSMGSDFSSIVLIAVRRPEVAQTIRACVRGS